MTRVAIIGTAGFAGSHHGAIQALEAAGDCRLVCTCDVSEELLQSARQRFDLERRGVRVYTDYQQMLDAHRDELDVVTVPTGIPLHAPMHRACVERGLPCYLEKPPTLDPDELERMIAVDEGAAKKTQVAFNFIVEEMRKGLKERLLAGEFGPLRRVSYRILWPRLTSYFTRNAWAGRLLWNDGRLILDSCIGNAMAHYTHNLLFWAGTDGGVYSWASPVEVQADLYRAHAIESFDTAFIRATLDTGAALRIAASHAVEGAAEQGERVECEDATITYITGKTYEITGRDGRVLEQGSPDSQYLLPENFRAYFAYVRGDLPRPMTRLEDSRPFVRLNNLAFVSSGAITAVDAAHVRRTPSGEQGNDGEFVAIDGVREALAAFDRTGAFPAELRLPWARGGEAPQTARPEDLSRLRNVVGDMARQVQEK